jgi:hypothetical protein
MALVRLVKRLLGRKQEPEFPYDLETDDGGPQGGKGRVKTRL